MISIRKANITDDCDFILKELKSFSDFYCTEKHQLFGTDMDYMAKTISAMIDNHVVLMAIKDGKQVGFIVGVYYDHFFNPSIKVLAEQFWWVDESNRSSSAGFRLLKELIDIAESSANILTFSLLPQSPVKEESLTKLGFKLKEKAYIREF